MSYQFSVAFHNQSPEDGTVCLFQQQPDLNDDGIQSLAWQTKFTYSGTSVTFPWKLDYSFVWSQTGELQYNALFVASQVMPADLSTSNEITLNYNRAYHFINQQTGPTPGTLRVVQDSTIPANNAAVGIGMAGKGTFAVQARPRITTDFTPHPQYWITLGNYDQGQVLNPTSITNAAQLQFPSNVYTLSATLNEDNTWTVEPIVTVR